MKQGRFDRGAWLHLLLMLFWLLFAAGTTLYRFSLPTDGWLTTTPDSYNASGYIYQKNIMGLASELQSGDYVIAVNGVALSVDFPLSSWAVNPAWQSGNVMQYTVLRDGQALQLTAPLVKWNPWRFLSDTLNAAILVGWLGLAMFLVMGFLTFWLRPDEPAARALWVLSTIWFAAYTAIGLLPQMVVDDVNPLASLCTAVLIFSTFTILAPPAFIRFALVFPRPKPILLQHLWIALIPYGVGVIGLGAFMLRIYAFGFIWTGLSVLISILLLLHNAATMRDAVSRAQLRWGLGGMIAGLGLFFLMYIPVFTGLSGPTADILNAIGPIGFGVMGVTLGIAVLRYRLWDIDFIIRKTLVYAILSALLAVVYYGGVMVMGLLTADRGQPSPVVIVLTTLIIAALFTPLRRRIQDFIDRRFYRRKYDAEKALADFAATARSETDLQALTLKLIIVVGETMQPAKAGLWLKQDRQSQGAGSSKRTGPEHLPFTRLERQ